jgi:hypothetical protein
VVAPVDKNFECAFIAGEIGHVVAERQEGEEG